MKVFATVEVNFFPVRVEVFCRQESKQAAIKVVPLCKHCEKRHGSVPISVRNRKLCRIFSHKVYLKCRIPLALNDALSWEQLECNMYLNTVVIIQPEVCVTKQLVFREVFRNIFVTTKP